MYKVYLSITSKIIWFNVLIQDIGSKESYLNQSDWVEVIGIMQVLEIPYATAISLKKCDLTPREYLLCVRKVISNIEKLEKNA